MKRIVSSLIAICIMLSLVAGVEVLADANSTEVVLLSDNFSKDNITTTGKWTDSGSLEVDKCEYFIDSGDTNYGRVFSFNKQDTLDSPNIRADFSTVSSGEFLLSFDLYIESSVRSDNFTVSVNNEYELFKVANSDGVKLWPRGIDSVVTTTNKWSHIDISADLNDGNASISYYIDGKKQSQIHNAALSGISSVVFGAILTDSSEYLIDNVVVRHNPSELAIKRILPYGKCSYVDVEFNNAISADSDLSSIIIRKLGTDNCDITLNEVKLVRGNTVRLKYAGIIDPGREYIIYTNGAVKSIFDEIANNEILFNADDKKDKESLTLNFAGLNNETVLQDISQILYEDGTDSLLTKTVSTTSDGVKYVQVGHRSNDYKTTIIYSKVDTAEHPDFAKATGMVSYKFDLYLKSQGNFRIMYGNDVRIFWLEKNPTDPAGSFVFKYKNKAGQEIGITDKVFEADAWNSVEILFDYSQKNIKVMVEDELIYNPTMDEMHWVSDRLGSGGLQLIEYAPSDLFYRIANLSVSYSQVFPAVTGVRYIVDDVENYNDTQNSVKSIKIKFNQAMDIESLNGITLNSNDTNIEYSGAYDIAENTYTLTPTTDLTDGMYKLKVPTTVKSGDNECIQNSVEYNLCIGSKRTSITLFEFVDENGNKLTSLDAGTIVKAKLMGSYYGKPGTYIIIAKYSKDEVVTDVVCEALEIDESLSGKAFTKITEKSLTADSGDTIIKAYVWDGLNELVPLTESIRIPDVK